MTVRFGTEGWRAVISEEFTFANVRLVAQAIADYYTRSYRGRRAPMVVGYDTRFLSDRYARLVAEVLAANGVRVVLADRVCPTCAVSAAVVRRRCMGGVMITASHNPPSFNGIKVKEWFGGSAEPQTVAQIERWVGRHPVRRAAEAARHITHDNFLTDHLTAIRGFVDLPAVRRAPLRLVVDSMHGTGGTLIAELLTGGRCQVTTVRGAPDPLFGGGAPEPIPQRLGPLMQAVRRQRAHLGLANDGDADRIGAVGPDGAFIGPGLILCLLLKHLVMERGWRGEVVRSVSNTVLIDRLAQRHGLRVHETPVGFKYIAQLMRSRDVLIGGEESGGIGVKGYLPERDGLLNGLLLAELLAVRGRTMPQLLTELYQDLGRVYYLRQDLHTPLAANRALLDRLKRHPPARLAGQPVVRVNTLDGVKYLLRGDAWLLFRASGTEPILRIYAEAPTQRQAQALLAWGRRAAHQRPHG